MNSNTEMLMQMLLSGNAPGIGLDSTSLNQMLAGLEQSDPRMAALIRHLQTRLTAQSALSESTEAESGAADDSIEDDNAALIEMNRQLKEMADRMSSELDALRARNDMLAAALGACHLCWGDDRKCQYCQGAGRIGAYVIERPLFDEVIGPAVRQFTRPQLVNKTATNRKGENDAQRT